MILVLYALGLLGWLWDDLEHLRIIDFGVGAAPAHYLMYTSGLLIIALLVGRRARSLRVVLGSGVLVILAGVIVDLVWHGVEGVSEEGANMLLMPGHTIQLAGGPGADAFACPCGAGPRPSQGLAPGHFLEERFDFDVHEPAVLRGAVVPHPTHNPVLIYQDEGMARLAGRHRPLEDAIRFRDPAVFV